MQIFIDSANIEEIREAAALGVIAGVTTNPSLIAKEKRDYRETLGIISGMVDGPISAEVLSTDFKAMLDEAQSLQAIHPNINIKVPISAEGLRTITELARRGIKTNCTLVFSAGQALLAARAGATFVSPFVGRLDDISNDGLAVLNDIVTIYNNYAIDTQVISASIRHPMHVVESARIGADIATVPYKIIMQLIQHPLTERGIEKFLQDYQAAF
ncbi:MAG: fructose-6-phosphate aldolase [Syntrophomonadaceae bacterium]|nr:fructose-6-phosphate aldolase [Syntrophomonadaceae bacterium]